MARQPLVGLGRLIFRVFTITQLRHTTLGRTPLDEGPARRRDLYLTTHNTHKRQTSMPTVGFFFLFFFFACPGFFPLWSIFVLFKSFRPSCHFTFHATVLITNTTQTSISLGGIRTHDPSKRAAADPRLRPHGHYSTLRLYLIWVIWLNAFIWSVFIFHELYTIYITLVPRVKWQEYTF
jgi:hypothetical protein